jgi:hypothetical protein
MKEIRVRSMVDGFHILIPDGRIKPLAIAFVGWERVKEER